MAWIIIGGLLVLTIFAGCKLLLRYYRKQYEKGAFASSADDHIAEVINPSRENDCYKRRCDRVYIFSLALGAMVVLVCAVGYFVSVHMDKMVEERAAAQVQKMEAEKQAKQLPPQSRKTGIKWALENDGDVWYSETAALNRFKAYLEEDKVYKEQRLAQIKLERQKLLAQKDAIRAEWLQIRTKGDATLQEINQKLYQKNMDDLDRQLADLESKAQRLKDNQVSFESWQRMGCLINAIFAAVLLCIWGFWVAYVQKDDYTVNQLFGYGGGILLLGSLVVNLLFYRFMFWGDVLLSILVLLATMFFGLLLSLPLGGCASYLREWYLNKLKNNENALVIARQSATIIAFIFTVLIIWGAWVLLY